MASVNNIPIVIPNNKNEDPLVTYTATESALKLSQISNVLSQRLGVNWKKVLVYITFFILGSAVLIIYGLSSDNKTYDAAISHMKAGLLTVLVSMVVIAIWASLKPYKKMNKYGVVPYPVNYEFIPPDSTQCGRTPTICDPNSPKDKGCNVLCVNNNSSKTENGGKSTSNNYECTLPNHPNVYYLGTRLDPKTHYCLPKQAAATIGSCDKDNGRVVWTLKPDGTQGWD